MDIVALLIQLVAGAAGGNIAGALLKNLSQGPLLNSILGIVGGGLGGQILAALLGGTGAVDPAATAGAADVAAGGLDIGAIIASIAGGGVGGGVLMAIVGVIRNMMGKNAA